MKKWLKFNFVHYILAFFILVPFMLMFMSEYDMNKYAINIFLKTEDQLREAVNLLHGLHSRYTSDYPEVLMLVFLILHGAMLWGQRNKSEREFLKTLPVAGEKTLFYRFTMDILLLTASIAVTSVVTYKYISNSYDKCEIVIPWLGSSIAGMSVTLFCYMIMILGIMYFMEALIVRGDMKVIATAFCMVMFHYSVNWLYQTKTFDQNSIFNKFVGFVNMYAVGGNRYIIEQNSWGAYDCWIPKNMTYNVFFQGKEYILSTYNNGIIVSYTGGVIGFSHIDLFVWYALGYMAIGVIATIVAVSLQKKQDTSKSVYYFDFATLIIGTLIFTTIFVFFFVQVPEYWYSWALIGLIAVAVFIHMSHKKRNIKLI